MSNKEFYSRIRDAAYESVADFILDTPLVELFGDIIDYDEKTEYRLLYELKEKIAWDIRRKSKSRML